MPSCMPLVTLQRFSRLYPDCWNKIESYRKRKFQGAAKWDDICYIPVPYTLAVIESYGYKRSNTYKNENSSALMAALAPWRQDKRIYRIPKDRAEQLAADAEDKGIPMDLLRQMPTYCIYVEVCGMIPKGFPDGINGFFAHVESYGDYQQLVLNILLTDGRDMPVGVEIVPDGTISDGLTGLYRQIRNDNRYKDPSGYIEAHYRLVSSVIHVLLYCCAYPEQFVPDPDQSKIYRPPKSPQFIKDRYREIQIWDLQ